MSKVARLKVLKSCVIHYIIDLLFILFWQTVLHFWYEVGVFYIFKFLPPLPNCACQRKINYKATYHFYNCIEPRKYEREIMLNGTISTWLWLLSVFSFCSMSVMASQLIKMNHFLWAQWKKYNWDQIWPFVWHSIALKTHWILMINSGHLRPIALVAMTILHYRKRNDLKGK